MSSPYLFDGPERAAATFVFAHGAGAPMDTPFMAAIAHGLAARGVRVVRFEFPYMAARRTTGVKKGPGPALRLLPHFGEVLDAIGSTGALFVGGKSMGGRIATHVADDLGARGVVCLGYPFHPPGKPDALRVENLTALAAPCLVLQGSRDSMGSREEVEGYALPKSLQLAWLEDGDHSFKPRKKSGFTLEAHLSTAVQLAGDFIERHAG